jgi:hypothetical protein
MIFGFKELKRLVCGFYGHPCPWMEINERTELLKHVAHAYNRWKCREGEKGNIDYLSAVLTSDFALRP